MALFGISKKAPQKPSADELEALWAQDGEPLLCAASHDYRLRLLGGWDESPWRLLVRDDGQRAVVTAADGVAAIHRYDVAAQEARRREEAASRLTGRQLTVQEAAARLGVQVSWVSGLRRAGKLTGERGPSGAWFYREGELDHYRRRVVAEEAVRKAERAQQRAAARAARWG